MMIKYLYHYQIPFVLIATKADKLPKTKIKPRIKEISTALAVGIDDITPSSAQTGYGKENILDIIEKVINLDIEE